MSQEFARCDCGVCGRHIEFPLAGAGMTIDCPACGQKTVLTAPPAESAEVAQEDIDGGLANSFSGPIRRVGASIFYQFGLLLVAMTMVLLPVLYVALIGCLACGVYWFAVYFHGMMGSMVGGARLYMLKMLFYLGTIFAGVVAVLFMFKPLFARKVKGAEPLALNPEVEQALYSFIAKISELTGAPMPKRIDLDCQLNASAGFRRGMFSFLGNDMVLTIGLPLVAGLNTRELAGVIAHEFGHFTQGFAMRLSYVINVVDRWFLRVVYQRDSWDVWLITAAEESEDWWMLFIVAGAQLAVGTSRLVLHGLMLVGHTVSCFLSRQMEYSADRYQIQMAGSAAFERTFIHLNVLEAAAKSAYKDMRSVWNTSRQLPEDFSACLLDHERRLRPEFKQRIEDTIGFAKTKLLDTHPSVADRIRRARQANDPGVFQLEIPAYRLFAAFEVVSKQVTLLHYADDLGLPFVPSMLKPVTAARE